MTLGKEGNMFTTIDQVKDWRDLQIKVRQLFDEMHYETELEKVVDLAGRGKKEVDVFILDPLASHNQIYLVECKHWETLIHQDVVHGFKTVMEGAGASTGYIISKKGFQSGAHEAVRYTNIQLLTFEELQHLYGQEWFRKKSAKLECLKEQLGEIYRCHFEQGSRLPIMNNGKFNLNGLGKKLAYYHHWVSELLLTISANKPENYLGPEPIQLVHNPADPKKPLNGWFEIPTVREYFTLVESSASNCIEGFRALNKEANQKVNALDDKQFKDQSNRTTHLLIEEMPIRILKGKVTNEEYNRLLKAIA